MLLNKVNLCWVLSDGRKGHEVQSMALASRIADQVLLKTFHIKQPWLTFAPRIIPGMSHGIIWQGAKPDLNNHPDLIISTGRKAAAVGKYLSQRITYNQHSVKHIQILHPKDQPTNYDLLLTPEHDLKPGSNVIQFSGSIHPFDQQWFSQMNRTFSSNPCDVALILGNPNIKYFKNTLISDINKIRKMTANQPITVCGSPRLSKGVVETIRTQFNADDSMWFDESDGTNPYHRILATSPHIFVTADSINMMNECAASEARVTLLAKSQISSKKHQRFIQSLSHRWSDFETLNDNKESPNALDQIINNPMFQKLLNSPFSSNSG